MSDSTRAQAPHYTLTTGNKLIFVMIMIMIMIMIITIIIITITSNDIIKLRNQAINISDRLHVNLPEITMDGIYAVPTV